LDISFYCTDDKLDPRVLEQHRLLAGNPAQFQGDERDIVFISLVDSNQDGHVLPLRQSDMYKKRYNVAASRARDQLWIVHSLNHATDLKAADLRRRLIEHAHDPSSVNVRIEAAEKKADSIFERRVLESLIRKGYKVTPQWPVGKFRIDLVVEGKLRRLAVELDGEKYHPPEKLTEDMERQAMLERAGWQFVRIRGSLYFRNPERALKPLFDVLTELGIEPEGQPMIVGQAPVGRLQEIFRTAERIRRDWGFEEEVLEEEAVPELRPQAEDRVGNNRMSMGKHMDGGYTIDLEFFPYNGPLDVPSLLEGLHAMTGSIPVFPPLGRACSKRVREIAMERDGQESPGVFLAIGLKDTNGLTCL
jgi:very-short-patch-repair endonuclease